MFMCLQNALAASNTVSKVSALIVKSSASRTATITSRFPSKETKRLQMQSRNTLISMNIITSSTTMKISLSSKPTRNTRNNHFSLRLQGPIWGLFKSQILKAFLLSSSQISNYFRNPDSHGPSFENIRTPNLHNPSFEV